MGDISDIFLAGEGWDNRLVASFTVATPCGGMGLPIRAVARLLGIVGPSAKVFFLPSLPDGMFIKGRGVGGRRGEGGGGYRIC